MAIDLEIQPHTNSTNTVTNRLANSTGFFLLRLVATRQVKMISHILLM